METSRPKASAGRIFLFAVALVLFNVISTALEFPQLFARPYHLKPIEITVDGLPPSDVDSVAVTVALTAKADANGDLPEAPAYRHARAFSWEWNSFWIDSLRLHCTEDALNRIKQIHVRCGSVTEDFGRGEVEKWKPVAAHHWILPERTGQAMVSLVVPIVKTGLTINAPDTGALLLEAASPGLGISLSVMLLLFFVGQVYRRPSFREFLQSALTDKIEQKSSGSAGKSGTSGTSGRSGKAAFLTGLAVVICGLAILYNMEPYPFTQDDSFDQMLPVILRSSETLLHGHFPVWNPYQLLGCPTTTFGIYALTYPPLYLCAYAARFLLGKPNAAIELYAVFHLLAGYCALYWALRRFKISPWLAAAGSVCWILSGWFLVGGRSQFTFLAYALFLPLAMDSVNTLARRNLGWCWALRTGLVLGVLFHTGHAEFWVYTVMFMTLAVVLLGVSRSINATKLQWAVCALLVAISIASPLLWLQKLETDTVPRGGGATWAVSVLPMLLPLGKFGWDGIYLGGVKYQYLNEMYYAGTIFSVVGLFFFLICLTAFALNRSLINKHVVSRNVWLWLGGIAFILWLGAPMVFYSILSCLPIFSKFRWALKYIFFVQLFFVFGGGLILERLTKNVRPARIGIACAAFALMLFHVNLCQTSFFKFHDEPYAKLEPEIARFVQRDQLRVFSCAPYRTSAENFEQSMVDNFASVYKVFSFTGYETFVSSTKEYVKASEFLARDTLEAARAYGIGAVVWSDTMLHPPPGGNPMAQIMEVPEQIQFEIGLKLRGAQAAVADCGHTRIYAVARPDPIVFETGNPAKAINYEIDQSGVFISIPQTEKVSSVTVNFLRRPFTTALVDGRKVSLSADKWGRIEVPLEAGAKFLRIGYSPPWALSWSLAVVFAIGAYLVGRASKFRA